MLEQPRRLPGLFGIIVTFLSSYLFLHLARGVGRTSMRHSMGAKIRFEP